MSNIDKIIDSAVAGVTTPSDESTKEQWARDAMWVWSVIDKRPSRRAAKTGSRYQLWKYAKENMSEYIRHIMPNATSILNKQQNDEDQVALKRHEQQSIESLQKLLKEVVNDSGKV